MINNLTKGMIRLSEEISTLRHNRAALTYDLLLERANLRNTVSEMIAGFQIDREKTGEKTRAEVGECVSHVKAAVAGLRQNVAELRAKFASDLIGAHSAWSGSAAELTPRRILSMGEHFGHPNELPRIVPAEEHFGHPDELPQVVDAEEHYNHASGDSIYAASQ